VPDVLFVCTGNLHRSPIAEGIFRRRVREAEEGDDWQVMSAGTWTEEGRKLDYGTLTLLESTGIDMRGHRSREVNEGLIKAADIIFTMEEGQKEALEVEFPAESDKVYLLSEIQGTIDEIPDPAGGTEEDLRRVMAQIDHYLENGVDQVRKMIGGSPEERA